MKFPALIHKDHDSVYGVTIPDIPGCFTSGATLDGALANIQPAVELFYDGTKAKSLPAASRIEDLLESALDVKKGFWMLVDIDFSFLSPKIIRISMTMPKYKLMMIDKAAKERNLSRSAFLAAAAEQTIHLETMGIATKGTSRDIHKPQYRNPEYKDLCKRFWDAYEKLSGLTETGINFSPDQDFIMVNLNYFKEMCAAHNIEPFDFTFLKRVLPHNKKHLFVEKNRSVRSKTLDKTFKCWVFKK